MNRRKVLAAVFVVAAVALTVGLTTASNMAFKLNYVIQNPTTRGGTGTCQICRNWVSLPLSNQFQGQRVRALCSLATNIGFITQQGVHSGVGDATTIDTSRIDQLAGPHSCTALASLTPNWVLVPNAPIGIILTSASTGDRNAIIVGADVPGTQLQVRKTAADGGSAPCTVCANIEELVYHTTAVRLYDYCAEMPGALFLSQPGSTTGFGTSTALNANNIDRWTGPTSCASSASLTPNPTVQIGRPLRIILKTSGTGEPAGDILWSPAHF
jgi:hypothetical protein